MQIVEIPRAAPDAGPPAGHSARPGRLVPDCGRAVLDWRAC